MADDSDQVVVLGGEMAAAAAAERRHTPTGPSPIAGIRYPVGSGDLWRWVDRPEDAAVSAFVGEYTGSDVQGQAALRANLSMGDLYTVLLFARRRAFWAIRTADPGAVVDAFDALSAVDIERVDWRDVSVAAMFAAYAAAGSGVTALAAAAAVSRAEPQVAEVIAAAVDEDEIDLADSCGYRVVATADGAALFEDDGESYEPDRDLVPIALGVAAAVEQDGRYRVEGVGIGQELPPIWVGADVDRRVAAAVEGMTGCMTVTAAPVGGQVRSPGRHFLNVYLAEAATAEQAVIVARGADSIEGTRSVVSGIAARRLCAVVVAASTSADQPPIETAASLDRLRSKIADLLG
ncbi:hypothetical protein [Phytohabitans rumicis]|uniref:hypothetical protein n=1 Tax=Phytohabitans rumicis TaxID=1076125 RepID=UPI0015679777